MNDVANPAPSTIRNLRIGILAVTLLTGLLVVWVINQYPRTDTAVVFANYIGIAPQVDGPITRFYVRDNQFVKSGELLFEIDDRPYRYALERVESTSRPLKARSWTSPAPSPRSRAVRCLTGQHPQRASRP